MIEAQNARSGNLASRTHAQINPTCTLRQVNAGDLRARRRAIVIITHLVIEQDRFDILADLADGRLTIRVAAAKDPDVRH